MDIQCIIDSKNILAEGPVWDARNQTLYWVDIEAAKLYFHNFENHQQKSIALPSKPGCIALHQNPKKLLIALSRSFCLLDLTNENFDELGDQLPAQSAVVFNDGKIDCNGNLWIGSKALNEVDSIAALYRYDDKKNFIQKDDHFVVANGLDWNVENTKMFFTNAPHIYVYDFNRKTSDLSNRQIFATIPQEKGIPDGLCVDAENGVWSAHWMGSRITRYHPNGKIDFEIELPVPCPSSCFFGGKNLKTLFITTARRNLTPQQLQDYPQSGGIFALETEFRGQTSNVCCF